MKNRSGESLLKRSERSGSLLGPLKSILAKQLGEGGRNEPVVTDETPIITGEAKKTPDGPDRFWNRLGKDCLHLFCIHGDTLSRDHVSKITH